MSLINKPAMYAAIAGGLCLLLAGITGYAAWSSIRDIIVTYVSNDPLVHDIFYYLLIIAGLGGLAVILGGLLIGWDKVGVGKFLIALGAGMGLIGFLISFVLWYLNGMEGAFAIGGSILGFIGIVLSIIARQMAY
ncbi:MAG: hypothetical protein V1934_00800 [Methanobacteriota archaeon]